jgi:hypothetical protein
LQSNFQAQTETRRLDSKPKLDQEGPLGFLFGEISALKRQFNTGNSNTLDAYTSTPFINTDEPTGLQWFQSENSTLRNKHALFYFECG